MNRPDADTENGLERKSGGRDAEEEKGLNGDPRTQVERITRRGRRVFVILASRVERGGKKASRRRGSLAVGLFQDDGSRVERQQIALGPVSLPLLDCHIPSRWSSLSTA